MCLHSIIIVIITLFKVGTSLANAIKKPTKKYKNIHQGKKE